MLPAEYFYDESNILLHSVFTKKFSHNGSIDSWFTPHLIPQQSLRSNLQSRIESKLYLITQYVQLPRLLCAYTHQFSCTCLQVTLYVTVFRSKIAMVDIFTCAAFSQAPPTYQVSAIAISLLKTFFINKMLTLKSFN